MKKTQTYKVMLAYDDCACLRESTCHVSARSKTEAIRKARRVFGLEPEDKVIRSKVE